MTDTHQSKGGIARARALDPERRAEIAKAAAQARWNTPARPRKPPARPREKITLRSVLNAIIDEIGRDGIPSPTTLRHACRLLGRSDERPI